MTFRLNIPFLRIADSTHFTTRISDFDKRTIEKAFTRLFTSEDGKMVLAYLQACVFQRAHNANASDEQLRFTEGQRALLGTVLRHIEQGRKG